MSPQSANQPVCKHKLELCSSVGQNDIVDGLWGIPPFFVERGPQPTPPNAAPFDFRASTTASNALRVLRALQLKKAVLLEGSPGVGKTSLVAALATAIGQCTCLVAALATAIGQCTWGNTAFDQARFCICAQLLMSQTGLGINLISRLVDRKQHCQKVTSNCTQTKVESTQMSCCLSSCLLQLQWQQFVSIGSAQGVGCSQVFTAQLWLQKHCIVRACCIPIVCWLCWAVLRCVLFVCRAKASPHQPE